MHVIFYSLFIESGTNEGLGNPSHRLHLGQGAGKMSLSNPSRPNHQQKPTMVAPTDHYPPVDAVPGPIYVDTQHEDLVHDAQMDFYGTRLATCSSGALSCRCNALLRSGTQNPPFAHAIL
jgi:hypothetical protein